MANDREWPCMWYISSFWFILVRHRSAPYIGENLEKVSRAAISAPRQFGDPHRADTAADSPGALLRENRQGPSSWVLPGRDRWNVDRSALSGQWVIRNRSSWTCGRHHGSRRGEGPGLLASPRSR